jgi:hypothetical protein
VARNIDILSYLPEILASADCMKAISAAQNPKLSSAYEDIDKLLDNQFIISADENGIKRWERILGISPKATNTLQDRRFRVLSRVNSKLPYTIKRLHEQLEILCPDEGFELELEAQYFTLRIRVALAAKEQFDEVEKLTARQSPANLILDISLRYNTYGVLGAFTHQELGSYTHTQLREELIS